MQDNKHSPYSSKITTKEQEREGCINSLSSKELLSLLKIYFLLIGIPEQRLNTVEFFIQIYPTFKAPSEILNLQVNRKD